MQIMQEASQVGLSIQYRCCLFTLAATMKHAWLDCFPLVIAFLSTNTPDQTRILNHCIKTTNYLFTLVLFLLTLFPYHKENKTLKILLLPYIPTKRLNSGKYFISLLHPCSAEFAVIV